MLRQSDERGFHRRHGGCNRAPGSDLATGMPFSSFDLLDGVHGDTHEATSQVTGHASSATVTVGGGRGYR